MYQQRIAEELRRDHRIGYDPRHVEAYMRLEHPTLDGLTAQQFRAEVAIGVQCIDADGRDNAESCARSFGL